jgi:predicted ribosome quality control (RQC) complex YloA/Tae2 family protein
LEQSARRLREKAARPWREYLTPQGAIIRVGKGADSNEKLLKLARGQDIWLHTRNWPGAYVWVPLQKHEQIRPETLRSAALLALHFSQLPNENKAEIMYTPFKFLQKQRKAKTGEVSVRQFKSLIVSPDRDSLAGLLNSKSQ